MRSVVEVQGEVQDEEVQRLRRTLLEEFKDTTFRPQVWEDPPIRRPFGEAEIILKPGVFPVIQRPFMLTGERREAMAEIIREFEEWGLLEPGV